MKSYIYIIFRPNGTPCYVGKGTGDRWKRHDRKEKQNPHLWNIIKQAGGDPPTVIIKDGLNDKDALEFEIAFIKAIGREINGGPLVNMTDGGEGTVGAKMTDAWREHRSLQALKVWQRPEFRAKVLREDRNRSGNKNPRTEEFKKIVAEKLKGNTHTLGYSHTQETKDKMSISRRGVHKSKSHSLAIALALIGKKHSIERRNTMMAGQFRFREYRQSQKLDFIIGC